ncbi:hypothetical protein [Acinetobacter sp. WU_MDCI_Abxc22]|uniref:hypothetical protein n=1 Tax=Acinetobacter sp. WU_MDCI_Abxc22 TaxID=2850071 RepID=UPI0021CDE647|nr:hypothetical protein [Acinetobacter sp. WU_MDCI_Abxc22]
MMLSEIRDQLAIVAQRNGRPPYDLCVLKAVRFAVENGTEHPLKEHLIKVKQAKKQLEIIRNPSNKSGPKMAQATQEEIEEMCEWISDENGRQVMLAEEADTTPSVLWRMKRTSSCTKVLYNRLVKARAAIEKRQSLIHFLKHEMRLLRKAWRITPEESVRSAKQQHAMSLATNVFTAWLRQISAKRRRQHEKA